MAAYVVRRLALVLPLLLIVSFVSFVAVDLMPGDYVTRLEVSPEFSTETIERFRSEFGLDRSVIARYGLWLRNLLMRGDFGTSFETSRPVFESLFLGGRLGRTVLISGTTILFMWLVAIPLGVFAAVHVGRMVDRVLAAAGFVILSVPGFLVGLVLMWFLVSVLHTGAHGLGVGGLVDGRFIGEPLTWAKVGSILWHLWPVWIVVGLSGAVGLMRVTRGAVLDELGKQYVVAARARGVGERSVLYRHAFKNAVNPLISILGMQLPRLVGGSLVASILFGLQTVEGAFWTAIQRQDTYVILGGLLFFGLFLTLGNLMADLLLAWADPRVRFD